MNIHYLKKKKKKPYKTRQKMSMTQMLKQYANVVANYFPPRQL